MVVVVVDILLEWDTQEVKKPLRDDAKSRPQIDLNPLDTRGTNISSVV